MFIAVKHSGSAHVYWLFCDCKLFAIYFYWQVIAKVKLDQEKSVNRWTESPDMMGRKETKQTNYYSHTKQYGK